MMHEGGDAELTTAVRKALDGLLATLGEPGRHQARRDPRAGDRRQPDHAPPPARHRPDAARLRAVRAGDRRAPSRPRARSSASAPIPGARVYVLPCIAGHVGADTAGVILAEEPHARRRTLTLVVDVGTNAEIVLGNRDRLLAASSPTGPAFEGAQIRRGQRAAPGAIERVRIDRDDARAALPGHRRRAWSDAPELRRRGSPRRHRRHRDLRLGDHRGRRRAVPRRRRSPPTASSTARSPRGRRGSSPTAGRSATSCTSRPTAVRGSSSPRTTSGPSSSPRPRSTPASGC